jgi:hypothetical protein
MRSEGPKQRAPESSRQVDLTGQVARDFRPVVFFFMTRPLMDAGYIL